jgi:quercetin dioxygenase-like cupin family protein
MLIRRFSADLKTKIPDRQPGVYGVPIQLDSAHMFTQNKEKIAQRLNGLPILLDRPMIVVAMYFEPHASIDEHSSDVPILFLVLGGKGFVRIGGPNGEVQPISTGDAVLWPAKLEHTVWTEDEEMQELVIVGPPERE